MRGSMCPSLLLSGVAGLLLTTTAFGQGFQGGLRCGW